MGLHCYWRHKARKINSVYGLQMEWADNDAVATHCGRIVGEQAKPQPLHAPKQSVVFDDDDGQSLEKAFNCL